MKIAAFQALVPKKSLLKQPISDLKPSYIYKNLENAYKRKAEAFWLLRIAKNDQFTLGIVTLIDIANSETKILPHEEVIPDKVIKTIQKTTDYGAQINPVLLLHEDDQTLYQFLNEIVNIRPEDIAYSENGTSYQLWRLNDRLSVQFFQNHFKDYNRLFIADGHHRMAAQTQKYEQDPTEDNRFIFAAVFPLEDMEIKPYYRMVHYSGTEYHLIEQLQKFFTIEPNFKKQAGIWFHSSEKSWSLFWKNPIERLEDSYDALHDKILEPIFCHTNGVEKTIKYLKSDKSVTEVQLDMNPGDYLFELAPLDKRAFVDISVQGRRLPPKSTLFLPRMKRGLIVHNPIK